MNPSVPAPFRDGTGQRHRMLPALSPDYISVEERSTEDLLRFTRKFAEKVRYFNERNLPEGSWSRFLNITSYPTTSPEDDIKLITEFLDNPQAFEHDTAIKEMLTRPHFVLFLTFLQLLRHPREQFQELTRLHLDYYYREVLKLHEKTAIPDKVYVLLEPAEDVTSYLVKAGTLLDAGQDSAGEDLHYATEEDIVVNRARISDIKTVSVEKSANGIHLIRAATVAGSTEGDAFTPGRFGILDTTSPGGSTPIGFAVVSPVLLLNEGRRTVTLTLVYKEGTLENEDLDEVLRKGISPFEVFLSSEAGWWQCASTQIRTGNFISGESLETYPPETLPPVTSREPTAPVMFTVGPDALNESQRGQYLIAKDRKAYLITEVIRYQDHQQVGLEFVGTVRGQGGFTTYDIHHNCLRLVLSLGENDPPITPPIPGNSPHDLGTAYPVLKVLLKTFTASEDDEEKEVTCYELLRTAVLEKVRIDVTVEGIRDMLLRNDDLLLDPKSPFEPFGSIPQPGSGLYFVNPEISGKRLTSLDLHIAWAGLPEDFAEHYRLYSRYGSGQEEITNTSFTAQLKFLHNRLWCDIEASKTLFSSTLQDTTKLSYTAFDISRYDTNPDSFAAITNDPLEMPRCFKLELGYPDFQHGAYAQVINRLAALATQDAAEVSRQKLEETLEILKLPFIFKEISGLIKLLIKSVSTILKPFIKLFKKIKKQSEKALKEAQKQKEEYEKKLKEAGVITEGEAGAEEGEEETEPPTVPPPYTPLIKAMSLDYSSSVEINLAATDTGVNGLEKIYHLHPFGYTDLQRTCEEETETSSGASGAIFYLLPQYLDEGYLYLGISDLQPPQNLSILMQMATKYTGPEMLTPAVRWGYLDGNCWRDFTGDEILKDTTLSLLDTGIIRFSVPASASTHHTLMPPGCHWIRAQVTENAPAVPDILAVKTQAVSAIFEDQGNAPDHLSQPLPAATITKLAAADPAIKEVSQPGSSFGGRMQETETMFYTRVSERLRHKQRALTTWDYERIILEAFPAIQKAKCLNKVEQTQLEARRASSPSTVTVVVVPDITGGIENFSEGPCVPQNQLKQIENYLRIYTSPFVEMEIRNPRYLMVRYRLAVRFRESRDPGYYLRRLNADIREFISPWAFGKDTEISFGGGRNYWELWHFAETREYVDYVTNLKVIEPWGIEKEEDFSSSPDASPYNWPLSPDTVLVSAREHIIDLIPAIYRKEDFEGIGYMIIGVDFTPSRPTLPPGGIGRMVIGKDFTVSSKH